MQSIHPAEVRIFLREHNISQNKAAELCMINPRTLKKMMAGTKPIPAGLFELLRMKVNELDRTGI